MNPLHLQQSNQILFLQRNILLFVTLILLISVLILSSCLLLKGTKTIIVPATLSREVTLEGSNSFSEEYIEEMSIFFAHLLLNLSAENISYNSQLLLKYASAESYHILEEYFKSEEQKCKKYNLVTRFNIKKLKIIDSGRSAEIEGILESRFASDATQKSRAKFVIEYGSLAGRLLITGFTASEQVC